MAQFVMLGSYSQDAVEGIAAERTNKVVGMMEKSGGKIDSMYVLLGEYDLMLVVDFPGIKEVMKASIEVTKEVGISFVTSPALTVAEFDKDVA